MAAELPFDLFVGNGLVECHTDKLCITSLGRFFLRNLAFPLDVYRDATDGVKRFSRAD